MVTTLAASSCLLSSKPPTSIPIDAHSHMLYDSCSRGENSLFFQDLMRAVIRLAGSDWRAILFAKFRQGWKRQDKIVSTSTVSYSRNYCVTSKQPHADRLCLTTYSARKWNAVQVTAWTPLTVMAPRERSRSAKLYPGMPLTTTNMIARQTPC